MKIKIIYVPDDILFVSEEGAKEYLNYNDKEYLDAIKRGDIIVIPDNNSKIFDVYE